MHCDKWCKVPSVSFPKGQSPTNIFQKGIVLDKPEENLWNALSVVDASYEDQDCASTFDPDMDESEHAIMLPERLLGSVKCRSLGKVERVDEELQHMLTLPSHMPDG